MAKNTIRTYSSTAASNTDVGGVDIQGTAPASNMDDAVREIMSHLAETNAGTAPLDDTFSLCDPADATKKVRIDAGSVTAGQTRVLTMPDANVTLPSGTLVTETGTQTLTNKTLTTPTITLKQGAAAAPTAEGDIQWDTDDNRLVIGDGAATQTFTPNPPSTAAGDIEYYTAANAKARLAKSTNGMFLSLASGVPAWAYAKPPLLHLQDQKAAGTDGGTFTSGDWRTRTLNTEVTDEIGSTLSSNQFTLPAGTYEVMAWATGYEVSYHVAKLRNITDSTDTLIGSAVRVPAGAATPSFVRGRFTIAGAKTFELQHRCTSSNADDGFGIAVNVGVTEIYADVMIWRVG